ncbi:DUF6350 family protein [Vallicoccus soli]|uniref:Integral membrane protein n=1 Tax=Vallicoccus soli TaxID=2339232 RepID=A0A3A3YX17_9ACTN|nr:DUF6350 family protein [Vallicoccus soli]RJK95263.1 hypothetical protein D5H78_11355 [Vallicoccus soli]
MATLLRPAPDAGPPDDPGAARRLTAALRGALPVGVAGAGAALRAAALGLLPLTLLVVLAWATAPRSGADSASALRAAGDLWLVAHHAPLSVRAASGGGTVGLAPLGLVALPLLLVRSAAGAAARRAAPGGWREGAALAVVLALAYAGVAALVALAAAAPEVRVAPGAAALGAGGLALVAALWGAWGAGQGPPLRPGARALLAGASTGAAALLAAGGLLATLALALGAGRVADASAGLDPGPVGQGLLVLLTALLAPNAAVWGAAVAAGPGFAVGEGTSVSAFLTDLGALPALPGLPLLGAVPPQGAAHPALAAALAAPLVAGVLTGLVVLRRRAALGARPTAPLAAAGHAALAGLGGGALLAALAALSGGPLLGGRLSAVGPSPWQVGLLGGLELALAAGATAYAARRRLPQEPAAGGTGGGPAAG